MTKVIDVSEVDEIQVINIRKGDALVIKLWQPMSSEAASRFREHVMAAIGCEIILIDPFAEVSSVLRREEK